MAGDEERLAILIEGRVKDFERAVAKVEKSVAKMQGKVDGEMRQVQRSSRRAADSMANDFERSNRRVIAQFSQVRGAVASTLGGLGIGAGVGIIGGAGLSSVVREINEAASSIAEMRAEAERAGLSFQAFQELKFAFAREKVSIDALTDGFKELQLRADEFIVTGKGSAVEAFQRLGYSAQALKEKLKDTPELLFDIMDRAQALDRAGQIRVFDELLGGTGGEQFVQLLDAGSDKIRESIARARELGVVLSDEVGEKAAEVDRRFQEITAVISGRLKESLVNVGFIVGEIGDKIGEWEGAAHRFFNALGNAEPLRRLNEWMIRNGSADTSGLSLIDPNLLIAEQERKVSELRDHLAEADKLAGLPESQMGITGLRVQKDIAAQLRDELEQAEAALAQMRAGGSTTITVRPEAGSLADRTTNGGVDTHNLNAAAAAGAAAVLAKYPSLSVSSAYRSPEYNAKVGGAPNSRHTHGDAVDLVGVNKDNVAEIVGALRQEGFRGFGYYNDGSLHADMGAPRAWGPDRTSASLGQTPYAFQEAVTAGPPVTSEMRRGAEDEQIAARTKAATEAAREQIALRKEQDDARKRQANAIEAVNTQLAEQLEMAGLEREMLETGKFTRDEVTIALSQEALVREKLNQLEAAGITVSAEMEAAIRSKAAALYDMLAASETAVQSQERLAERSAEMKSAFIGVGQPIVDTFMSIADGSAKAEDAIKGLIRQLANMVIQGALFGGGPLGGLFGGGLAGALFPARATGGPVTAGQPYKVGEHGEEVFVPGVNGRIVNAAAMRRAMPGPANQRGGGSQAVTFSINLDGANGDQQVAAIAKQAVREGLRQYDGQMQGAPLMRRIQGAQERFG